MFRKRPDGAYVSDLPALRRVMPYLMPTRMESQVFYSDSLEARALQDWLHERNSGRVLADRISLLHAYLTAIGRVLRLRPEANRFVVGLRTYQHRDIAVTFAVKKNMTDDGVLAEARVVLTGSETVEQVRDLVNAAIARARTEDSGDDERLLAVVGRWPRPALRLLAGLIGRLDHHNALPGRLIRAIPLYTSVYVAPLGSIGVNAPLHHLYRHGTASVFIAFGHVRPVPVVDAAGAVVARDCVSVGYTLDERISDGFYLAHSLTLFRRLLERPALLDVPGVTAEEIMDAP